MGMARRLIMVLLMTLSLINSSVEQKNLRQNNDYFTPIRKNVNVINENNIQKLYDPKIPLFNLSRANFDNFLNGNQVPEIFKNFLVGILDLFKEPATLLELALKLTDFLFEPRLPNVDLERWWSQDYTVNESITTAPIRFSQDMISLLKSRLHYRLPLQPSLYGVNMTYGFDADGLEYILNYWVHHYDFSSRQDYLNSLPQYVTKIQGLDIQFYRILPQSTDGKTVYPILLLHGWPQLHIEFLKVAKLLTSRKWVEYDFVFDVVIPSHPGFSYSEPTIKPGLTPYQIGSLYKKLMKRLGYQKFFIHGGDIGYVIGNTMATLFSDDILGYHATTAYTLNPRALVKYGIGALQPSLVVEPKYKNRMYPLWDTIYRLVLETGYLHQQTSRPDNLAGIRDSPVGLASWILHFFVIGANPGLLNVNEHNGILEYLCIDELLDSLTVHWDSKDFITAARFYAEAFSYIANPEQLLIEMYPSSVPFAPLKFEYEIIYFPDNLLRDKYKNLVHSTTLDFGGHFAALENPGVLANDIFDAVNAFIRFWKTNENQIGQS